MTTDMCQASPSPPQAAEEKYEREIVAHADAIKTLERTKEQLLQAQAASRDFQTRTETAQANLLAKEMSWKSQKEVMDKQILELSTRFVACSAGLSRRADLNDVSAQDLTAQNDLLHQHLESVSSQAARIRQAADSSVGDADDVNGPEPAASELRSVVSYLRKEKEIADLQLEINQQEIARLKADSERLARELDEQKALLAEVSLTDKQKCQNENDSHRNAPGQ